MTRSQNQGIQIGRRCRLFIFGNKMREILGKPLLILFDSMWWCGILLKRPGTFFEVFLYPGQQYANENVILIVLLVQFYSLVNKKRYNFYRTLSWMSKPSLRRHIVSSSPLGIIHPHPSTKPDHFGCKSGVQHQISSHH